MNELEIFKAISEEEDPDSYIPRPRVRVPEKKHYSLEKTHSHIQEVLASLEPSFKWDNLTLEKDRKRYYALCMGYLKATSEPSLMVLLKWCTDRNLHIRATNSVLNKALIKLRK